MKASKEVTLMQAEELLYAIVTVNFGLDYDL